MSNNQISIKTNSDNARQVSFPSISIGMPVYNGEQFITEAIESVLQQTHTDFELIISDNASTDGTAEICQGFVQRDSRVRYVRQRHNMGAPANFNLVYRMSDGKYFKWASANDVVAPNLLEKCKQVLDDRPDVVLCVGKTVYIDDQGMESGAYKQSLQINDQRAADRFLRAMRIYQNNAHAGLFRSVSIARTKLEGLYPYGDMVFLAELALNGKFVELPQTLFFRRISSNSCSIGKDRLSILQAHYPGSIRRLDCSHWLKFAGYFSGVRRSSIPQSQKLRLFARLLYEMGRSRSELIRDLIPHPHPGAESNGSSRDTW